MPAVWLCSDHHFGHEKTCTVFKKVDGSPLRPFSSAEEMDDELVKRHNERVRPKDKVYFLGDVAISRKALNTLRRLNGDKVLIRGNHDIFKLSDYTEHFRDIRGYHVMNGMILSHVPIHEDSIARFGTNIHGHLHANRVMRMDTYLSKPVVDVRYHCVCVEQTDFAPILFEDVIKRIQNEGGTVGFRNGNAPIM